MTERILRQLRWQHPLAFALLMLCLIALAYAAARYPLVLDQTHNHRNTLATASRTVLQQMPGQIRIVAYCSNSPYKGRYFRKSLSALVQRYQQAHPHLSLTFIDPFTTPSQARQVHKEGEMTIEYGGRQENMYLPYTEEHLTNLLLQLQHGAHAPILVAQPAAQAWSQHNPAFGASMQSAGLTLSPESLQTMSEHGQRPVLVLADAAASYNSSDQQRIRQHLDQGGSLLWVVRQPASQGLQWLAERFGIKVSDDPVTEPENIRYGIDAHDISSHRYAGQGPSMDFALRTFFLDAHAIRRMRPLDPAWTVMPLIATSDQSWVRDHEETPLRGQAAAGGVLQVHRGPLTMAMAFERRLDSGIYQRIMMIASPDFLSDSQQQRGGNQALTLRSLQWLVQHQPSVALPASPLRDTLISLPQTSLTRWWLVSTFHGFQFGLPVLLLLCSGLAWRRKYH